LAQVSNAFRSSASHRQMETVDDVRLLREPAPPYTAHSRLENADLSLENTWFWDFNAYESGPWCGPTGVRGLSQGTRLYAETSAEYD
jgi:hypothetical protein